MILNMLRKLFDPNYATKRVDAIKEDSKKKLERVKRSADKYHAIAKREDTSVVIFVAAGGKRHGR